MSLLQTFLWGFGGSIAVEIVNVYQVYQQELPKFPPRYTKPLFWLIRFLLAVVAGGLAIGYDIKNPILAANIGAATPLIIQALAQGIKPPMVDGQPAE